MKWTIDTARSRVEFVVRYVGISTIEGRFTRVRGTVETTEDGQLKAIEAFIPAASVDTGVSERDTHLRSPDFLDAAKFPELMFRAAAIERLGDGQYRVRGEITIRDRTHGTVFQVDTSPQVIDGLVADARGRVRPGHFPGGTGGWPGIGYYASAGCWSPTKCISPSTSRRSRTHPPPSSVPPALRRRAEALGCSWTRCPNPFRNRFSR